MSESEAARQLREAIEEQERIDKARREQVAAERRAELDRKQNERDRALNAERLKNAAGEK